MQSQRLDSSTAFATPAEIQPPEQSRFKRGDKSLKEKEKMPHVSQSGSEQHT